MRILIFLALILAACSDTPSKLEQNCLNLSQNYHKNLILKEQTHSLNALKIEHEGIIKKLLTNWPQEKENLAPFSALFFSFLNTRVHLNCGESLSKASLSKEEIKTGVFKVTDESFPSLFSECLKKEWGKSAPLIFQACKNHFTL